MESFCIIGLGCFGQTIATVLEDNGHQVLVIDESKDNIDKVAPIATDAVIGDPMNESVLAAAGVRNYSCVVICFSGRIHDTIILTMTLREMGVARIVARANSQQEFKVLQKIGVDEIVFPERDMGEKLALRLDKHDVLDYLRFSESYSIVDKKVPEGWIGQNLIQLGIRKRFGINIIAVHDGNTGKINISLSPDRVFVRGDVLTLIGSNKDIERISKEK